MKRLILACAIVFCAAALCYAALQAFDVEQDFRDSLFENRLALAMSSLLLGTIPYVHQLLDRSGAKRGFRALPGKLVRFESYTLPWYVMIVYGALIVYAVSGLGTLLLWTIGQVTGIYGVFTSVTLPALNTIATTLAFFFVGVWIGSRCDRLQLVTIVSVVLIYKVATTSIDLLIDPTIGIRTLLAFASSTIYYLIVAGFGWWRGRRARFAKYVQFLLRFLPPNMQRTLVDSTYEEIERVAPVRH